MRVLIMGATGSGKTAAAVRILQFIHEQMNYKLYANIELKDLDYTFLSDSNPLKNIKFNEKSGILIDEIGIAVRGNTIHSRAFSDLLAQSRKQFKTERSWLIMTAQIMPQIPTEVAELIDEIWTVCNNTVDGKPYKYGGLPYAIEYERKVYVPRYMNFVTYPKTKYIKGLHHAINHYDTFGKTDKFVTTQMAEFAEKYSEFIGDTKGKSDLIAILEEFEGMNTNEAKRMAHKIIIFDKMNEYKQRNDS